MKQRILLFCLALFLISTVLLGMLRPGTAHAASVSDADIRGATGTWVNRAQINLQVGSQTLVFTDKNIGDTDYTYSDPSYGCYSWLHFDDITKPTSGKLDMDYVPPGNVTGGCQDVGGKNTYVPIKVTDPPIAGGSASIIFFNLHDTKTVNRVDGSGKWQMIQSPDHADLYVSTGQGSGSCKDVMQINRTNNTYRYYSLASGTPSSPAETPPASIFAAGCLVIPYVTLGSAGNSTAMEQNKDYPLGIESTATQPPTDGGSGGGGGSLSSNAGTCEGGGGALSWVICPVIELLDNTTSALDAAIQAQLQTPDPTKVGCDQKLASCQTSTTKNALKDTWGRLRNIALIILVPIMLIMVIGTALGFQGLDAYTVKRAMPRLLIAVIFISLSWYVTSFLVNLTNVVGAGLLGLMTQPFDIANKTLGSFISGGAGATLSYTAILGTVGAVAVGALSIGIILSLMFTAALALFLGFVVLVIRQVIIFMLILLAPLAILAWIFPNSTKTWKLWWESFSKLLLMYPLIIALIASGRILASIIPQEQNGYNSLFTNVLIIVAYITPYFLIPATFKFAGGVFANISGMINDRGRGLFDRNKKFRQEQRAKNWQETMAGNRFKGGNANNLRGRLNSRIQQGAIIGTGKAGVAAWKKGRVSTVQTASTMQEIERNEKENADYLTWAGNDDLNKFASASTDEASLRAIMQKSGKYVGREAQMEQDVARVERTRRQMSNAAFKQMTFLHAVAGGTTYDTDDPESRKHNGVEWIEAATAAAGNDDAALANLINKGKSAAMAAGRADQGAVSFGTAFDAARSMRDEGVSSEEAAHAVHGNVLDSAGAGVLAHSSMKPNTIKRLLPEMKRRLADAANSGDQDKYDRELATFANLYDQMAGSSPQNAKLLADEVMLWSPHADTSGAQQQLPAGAAGPVQPGRMSSIQEDLLAARSSTVFTSTRRELSERDAESRHLGTPGGPGGPGGPSITFDGGSFT